MGVELGVHDYFWILELVTFDLKGYRAHQLFFLVTVDGSHVIHFLAPARVFANDLVQIFEPFVLRNIVLVLYHDNDHDTVFRELEIIGF